MFQRSLKSKFSEYSEIRISALGYLIESSVCVCVCVSVSVCVCERERERERERIGRR